MPDAEQLVQRHEPIAVVHLEIFLVEVMAVGMAVEGALTPLKARPEGASKDNLRRRRPGAVALDCPSRRKGFALRLRMRSVEARPLPQLHPDSYELNTIDRGPQR